MTTDYLYLGNFAPNEPQINNSRFIALALKPIHEREIEHNILNSFPFPDHTFTKVQSQDVFEHLPKESLPKVLDEIYRVLAPNGVFRLSVPDYRHPLLMSRSFYDYKGNIIGDVLMGATAHLNLSTNSMEAKFISGPDNHLWFPTYELILELILDSKIRFSREIIFHQCFKSRDEIVLGEIPDLEMPVIRSYPNDKRSHGQPISIVVDFYR